MMTDLSWPGWWTNHGFRKITPVNGFDAANPDNARQNSYAWSVAEMGDYLYVGTARNVLLGVLGSGMFGPIPVPPELIPAHLDNNAEIWRYKKDGSQGWQRVYKSPPDLAIGGFRFLILYTTPAGETALYAAGTAKGRVLILKSNDGLNWRPLPADIPAGNSSRAIAVHNGQLYMAVLPINEMQVAPTMIYVSSDPEAQGWQPLDLAGDPSRNPRGNAVSLLSFAGRLYVGTGLPGGFELWRTQGAEPVKDGWKLVVDKGAGDALNEFAAVMVPYRNFIYVGTALFAIRSLDPNRPYVPPKGFDVVRVTPDDRWQLVIGGPPVIPTQPTTGQRGLAISNLPSGCGNVFNTYCWQLQRQGGDLYLGSFDWSVILKYILPSVAEMLKKEYALDLNDYLTALQGYLSYLSPLILLLPQKLLELFRKNYGFDLWRSRDGERWQPLSFNGLNNPENYGVRNLFLAASGDLYLGTANPFEGCEVWLKKGSQS